MKILLIGSKVTIGRAIVEELSPRHDIVGLGRTSKNISVDITEPESIRKMFEMVGDFDALACTAGHLHFGSFEKMS
jgi:dTDP-4-dehydrorhamnose reductase